MIERIVAAFGAAVALCLSGCVEEAATSTTAREAPEDGMQTGRVVGSLTYRERIALAPGGVATVSLIDVSVADSEHVIAQQMIELVGQQPPLDFELGYDAGALAPGGHYVVRGDIRDPDGLRQWTTDSAHMIDPGEAETNLGTLTLVRLVALEEAGRGIVTTASYACGEATAAVRFEGEEAQLSLGGARFQLFRIPTTSGARYESPDGAVVLWEHGDVAMLDLEGRSYTDCRKRSS